MSDKQNKDIVDSQGNVLKSTKDNKVKQFLKTNIWNIWGTGLVAWNTLVGMMSLTTSKSYSTSCANFYGVDRKYFSGTEMFEDKLIFILCALVLFMYPFILSVINKKMNSKKYVVLTFLLTIFVLFAQNILYTVSLIDIIPWMWLRQFIDNYVTIGVFLVADILIAYFIIIRNYFWEKKKFNMVERILLTIALLIYISNTVIGITIKMNYDISDKKAYEVIEQNRAIISNYDDKFLVMDCEIQDETIILRKGTYRLEEMTGGTITYHIYKKVVCE